MEQKPLLSFYTAKKISAFTQDQLIRLTEAFRVVVITGNDPEVHDSSYSIVTPPRNFSFAQKLSHMLRRSSELLPLMMREVSSYGLKSGWLYHARSSYSLLLVSSLRCEALKSHFMKESSIHYAFFGNDYALILALAKRRGYIERFVFRVHGRDVIEEREPVTGKLPFQRMKYSECNKVYCVSEATKQYLKNRYPTYASKYEVAYLGSVNRGMGNYPESSEVFTVLSVGRVRNIKRFHLVGELVYQSRNKLLWIHFGDIDLNDPDAFLFQQACEKVSGQSGKTIDHRGNVAHEDLLTFMRENPIDLLINTSSYEGLPVSIQEALSFGIPTMATNVGGTSDIVSERTGLLVPEELIPDQEVTKMDDFLETKSREKSYRDGVRAFWEENLDAALNFNRFKKELMKLL